MKKNKKDRLLKRRNSLQSRYLLIVLAALLFIPILFPLSLIVTGLVGTLTREKPPAEAQMYNNVSTIEKKWHEEAHKLQGASAAEIDQRLRSLSVKYNKASMFWVDAQGATRLSLSAGEETARSKQVPARWAAAEAIAYMKESMKRDPLSIVAFIGDRAEAGEGFMVMEIPQKAMYRQPANGPGYWFGFILLAIFACFALVSWLFFNDIRKRLMGLERAMTATGPDGIPQPIIRGRADEIGRLEEAFNAMVSQLMESRRREAEEEVLRKQLVSDLSHDLRTPLTVIRSHVHVIHKESLTPRGEESLKLMDERISDMGTLIDNLLSYNLLNTGRVTLKLEKKDVQRLLRESAAAWYPLWEKEGFDIDIELEGEPLYWMVDETWFRRVLDNLYQNIIRHARSGRYIGIAMQWREGLRVIVIADHGEGMESQSQSKGAGLGLAIVELLLKQMRLTWEVESSRTGSRIMIYDPSSARKNLNEI